MTDATAEFFDALAERGHEPLLEQATGTVRFDLKDGKKTGRWLIAGQGRPRRLAPELRADCVVSADKALFDEIASGKTNGWQRCCAGRFASKATSSCWRSSSGSFPGRRAPENGAPRRLRRGRSDEQWPGSDPGRQHLRRQRLERRHRGVAHRPDRPLLVRHPLPVEMGSDHRRAEAQRSSIDDLQYFETRFFLVPGTEASTSTPSSPSSGGAVGNGFHEDLTILNHDDKPVDLAVRIEAGSDFADLFEVKDASRRRESTRPRGPRSPSPRLRARDVQARDCDLSVGASAPRQRWPRLPRTCRAARQLDHRTGRRHQRGCGRLVRSAEVRARSDTGAAEHGAEPRSGLQRHRSSNPTTTKLADVQAESRRPRRTAVLAAGRRGKDCLRPACRGS